MIPKIGAVGSRVSDVGAVCRRLEPLALALLPLLDLVFWNGSEYRIHAIPEALILARITS